MRIRAAAVVSAAVAAVVLGLAAPDPHRLAARLGADTARERDEAAAELTVLGDEAAPALESAARSGDPEVRSRARGLLERLRVRDDPSARSIQRSREVVALLSGADPRDDVLAVDGEIDRRLHDLAPEAGAVLADLALRRSRSAFVGSALAAALARHTTPESLAALATLWRDERLTPSAAMTSARQLDATTDGDRDAQSSLRATAVQAAETLRDVLDAREPSRRRAGLALLGAFAGDDAALSLLRAAEDSDAGVRCEAARVLGRHLPIAGADALRALARDADAGVRTAALVALRRVPGTPRPEPAVAAADDAAVSVRRAAAELLARDATPPELPLLDRLAADPSPSVRAAARRSLAALRAD